MLCPFPRARAQEEQSIPRSHRRRMAAALCLGLGRRGGLIPDDSHRTTQLSVPWGFAKGRNFVSVSAKGSLGVCGDRSDSLFVKDAPFSPSLSGPHLFERRVMVTNPLEAFEPSSRSPEKSYS